MDRKKSVLKQNAGMTLLEVIVTVAILAVIMVCIFEVLSRQGKIAAEELNEIDSQSNLRRAFTELVFELSDARIYAIANNGLSVTFGKPRSANGVPVMNADGTVSFGAMTDTGFVADAPTALPAQRSRYTLTFVDIADTLVRENDPDVNLDLNNDGDKTDQFVSGEFVLTTNLTGAIAFSQSRTVSARVVREFPNGSIFFMRQPFGTGIHRSESFTDNNSNNVYDKAVDLFKTTDDLNGNGIYDGPDSDGFRENAGTTNNIFDGTEGPESSNIDPISGNPIVYCSLRMRLMDLDLRTRGNETLSNASHLRISETLVRMRNQEKSF